MCVCALYCSHDRVCMCVILHVCVHARYPVCVRVCMTLCVCVFAMFCMKMFVNFHVLYACIPLISVLIGIGTLYVFKL